jgi:hypothetical protein
VASERAGDLAHDGAAVDVGQDDLEHRLDQHGEIAHDQLVAAGGEHDVARLLQHLEGGLGELTGQGRVGHRAGLAQVSGP